MTSRDKNWKERSLKDTEFAGTGQNKQIMAQSMVIYCITVEDNIFSLYKTTFWIKYLWYDVRAHTRLDGNIFTWKAVAVWVLYSYCGRVELSTVQVRQLTSVLEG